MIDGDDDDKREGDTEEESQPEALSAPDSETNGVFDAALGVADCESESRVDALIEPDLLTDFEALIDAEMTGVIVPLEHVVALLLQDIAADCEGSGDVVVIGEDDTVAVMLPEMDENTDNDVQGDEVAVAKGLSVARVTVSAALYDTVNVDVTLDDD